MTTPPFPPEDIIEIDEDGKVTALGPHSALDLKAISPAEPTPLQDAERFTTSRRSTPAPDLQAKLRAQALAYHKADDGEGEYGCPGLECPGVERLMKLSIAAYALGQSERARQQGLRVEVMTLVSDPYLTWVEARKRLTEALNASMESA